jgi:hypothetical protein
MKVSSTISVLICHKQLSLKLHVLRGSNSLT